MISFNDFLASGDGNLNRDQADGMLADLDRYGVTIRTWDDLWDFADRHPELFCPTTEEDKANGLQSLRMWWHRYKWWKQHQTPYNGPPLRSLVEQLRRFRS